MVEEQAKREKKVKTEGTRLWNVDELLPNYMDLNQEERTLHSQCCEELISNILTL
jgi:hypothetical protein